MNNKTLKTEKPELPPAILLDAAGLCAASRVYACQRSPYPDSTDGASPGCVKKHAAKRGPICCAVNVGDGWVGVPTREAPNGTGLLRKAEDPAQGICVMPKCSGQSRRNVNRSRALSDARLHGGRFCRGWEETSGAGREDSSAQRSALTKGVRLGGKLSFARRMKLKPTPAEATFWEALKRTKKWREFDRQVVIGKYIVDFYWTRGRVAIEIDGNQHRKLENRGYDLIRTDDLNRRGIKLRRYSNAEVLAEADKIVDEILCEFYDHESSYDIALQAKQ